ncbi:hypothetical protein [Desulforhopalus sp. 52FAK]
MNLELEKIKNRILEIQESYNEDNLLDSLYEITDALEGVESAQDIIPEIFKFMEALSNADLGAPGPLVHFIERFYPNYDELLLESIARKPVLLTIWMCNRILNDDIGKTRRIKFLEALESIEKNENLGIELREEAKNFLTQQLGSS